MPKGIKQGKKKRELTFVKNLPGTRDFTYALSFKLPNNTMN